jgi:hypothetical protein
MLFLPKTKTYREWYIQYCCPWLQHGLVLFNSISLNACDIINKEMLEYFFIPSVILAYNRINVTLNPIFPLNKKNFATAKIQSVDVLYAVDCLYNSFAVQGISPLHTQESGKNIFPKMEVVLAAARSEVTNRSISFLVNKY